MARYIDVPNEIKITSEMIEPAFQSMIGRWFAQAEYMRETYGQASMEHADALENLWHGLNALSTVAGLCIDTKHASMVLVNHTRQVGNYIEGQLGFHPSAADRGEFPFRRLTETLNK